MAEDSQPRCGQWPARIGQSLSFRFQFVGISRHFRRSPPIIEALGQDLVTQGPRTHHPNKLVNCLLCGHESLVHLLANILRQRPRLARPFASQRKCRSIRRRVVVISRGQKRPSLRCRMPFRGARAAAIFYDWERLLSLKDHNHTASMRAMVCASGGTPIAQCIRCVRTAWLA